MKNSLTTVICSWRDEELGASQTVELHAPAVPIYWWRPRKTLSRCWYLVHVVRSKQSGVWYQWCMGSSGGYSITWYQEAKRSIQEHFFSSELFITEPLFRNYHWLTLDIFSSVNYFCKCFSSLTKMPSSWHDSDFLSFIISSWYKVCVYVCIHFCFISSFINTFFNFKVSYKF